jgi:phage terminase large subunit
MEIELRSTKIFKRNLASTKPILLNIGGARSSKSYSILQLLLMFFVSKPKKKILITRKTGPALKGTAYKVFVDMLVDLGIYDQVEHNKTDRTFSFRGNYLAFLSIDDPLKIRSSEWNYIFMEEANEFDWQDFIVLKTRLSAPTTDDDPNKIFLALNPSDEHGWIHQKLEIQDNVEVIRSTYKDNPFLSKEYIGALEELKNQDQTFYKIFTLGEWATPTNIIYTRWDLVDDLPLIPDEVFYGLDFGFNNPSACVKVAVKDREIFVDQILCESKLTNADLMERLNFLRGEPSQVYADCAEPNRIEEMRREGFSVYPAEKSVSDGIDMLKRFTIHITKRSADVISEIRSYKWKEDPAGNPKEGEPVKFRDHLLDALRYAVYTHYIENPINESDLSTIHLEELVSVSLFEHY